MMPDKAAVEVFRPRGCTRADVAEPTSIPTGVRGMAPTDVAGAAGDGRMYPGGAYMYPSSASTRQLRKVAPAVRAYPGASLKAVAAPV
jgi:hypothetical protein